MDIINDFEKNLNAAFTDNQVLGPDAANARRNFMDTIKELSEEDINKNYKPLEYLKKKSNLVDIFEILTKNKKYSNVKIRQEIKKFLKDPEQLNDFLKSILDSRTKKGENKEATSSGGGVGAFEQPISFKKKVETKEATTSGAGVGAYDAPGFEDVKMRGNNPKGRGRSFKKPQLPGGKFVQVKKKCKRFPYCNQGDIKALNIFENETLKLTIEKISKKYGLTENLIKKFILKEIGINKNL